MSKSRRVPLPGFIRVTGIRLRETQTGLGRTPCPVGEGPYMEQPLPRQWLFFESFPVVGPDRSGPFRSRDEAMRRQRTLDPCRPEASSLSKTKPASRLLHRAIQSGNAGRRPYSVEFSKNPKARPEGFVVGRRHMVGARRPVNPGTRGKMLHLRNFRPPLSSTLV